MGFVLKSISSIEIYTDFKPIIDTHGLYYYPPLQDILFHLLQAFSDDHHYPGSLLALPDLLLYEIMVQAVKPIVDCETP